MYVGYLLFNSQKSVFKPGRGELISYPNPEQGSGDTQYIELRSSDHRKIRSGVIGMRVSPGKMFPAQVSLGMRVSPQIYY